MDRDMMNQFVDRRARYYFSYYRVHYRRGLIDGATWALQQSPWISLADRLPEVGGDGCSEYVFVRKGTYIPVVAEYTTNEYTKIYKFKRGRQTYENHWFAPNGEPLNELFTHWMPIPELPNDKTE